MNVFSLSSNKVIYIYINTHSSLKEHSQNDKETHKKCLFSLIKYFAVKRCFLSSSSSSSFVFLSNLLWLFVFDECLHGFLFLSYFFLFFSFFQKRGRYEKYSDNVFVFGKCRPTQMKWLSTNNGIRAKELMVPTSDGFQKLFIFII